MNKNNNKQEEINLNQIINSMLKYRLENGGRVTDTEYKIIRRAIKADFKMINNINIYAPTGEAMTKCLKLLGFAKNEANKLIGLTFVGSLFDSTAVSNSDTIQAVSDTLKELYSLMYNVGYRQFAARDNDLCIDSMKKDIQVVFGGELRFNTITKKIEFVGFDDFMQEHGFTEENKLEKYQEIVERIADIIKMYCRPKYRGVITDDVIINMMYRTARQQSYNPVREMLSNSKWDGIDRYPIIYEYLQQDDPMLQGIIKKWLIQCVALAFNRGYDQAETVLTLLGQQRCGKTMFFKALVPNEDWFRSIQSFDPKNKDSYITSISGWIAELSEVESLYRKEQDAVKTFLTQEKDTIRFPYDRDTRTMPRNTCFGATVNKRDFIGDDEARRWFVIEMQKSSLHLIDKLKGNALQIWAQVYQDYLKDKTGYRLTADEVNLIKRNNANEYTQELWGEAAILSLSFFRDGFTAPDNNKPKVKVRFIDIFQRYKRYHQRRQVFRQRQFDKRRWYFCRTNCKHRTRKR